jgi:hypothetical protein
MAILQTHVALDMHDWNLGNPAEGTLGAHDATSFLYSDADGRSHNFGGGDFEYFTHDSLTVPVDGEIESWTITEPGEVAAAFSLTGISVHVLLAAPFFVTDHIEWFEALVLSGDDTITGSKFGDVLDGFWGDDFIAGRRGDDVIEGGLGADVMHGGARLDTFVYEHALDSTSTGHDVILRFNAERDSFQFPDPVAAIDASIASGTASEATFDDDLAAAVDAAHLGAGNAVLFTPDAGDLKKHTFLIVDMNGDAGYQACEDAVIWLKKPFNLGSLSTANFIDG